MISENTTAPTVRQTVRTALSAVTAALVTGVAEPPEPRRQEWPPALRWTRWLGAGRQPYGTVVIAVDVIIAFVVFAGSFAEMRSTVLERDPEYSQATLFFAALALGAPVALRNRHPVAAWRIVLIAMIAVNANDWQSATYEGGGVVATLLCLYALAVRSPRDVTIGAGAICLLAVCLGDASSALVASLLVVGALGFGLLVRDRRATRQELAEQAQRHQDAEAVLTERQRIARELHDVVAHHMSMIAIQAEAAPYKVAELPAETRADLAEIRTTALDALTELRRVLGVLRSEAGAQTDPQPGLDRLDDLVANARSAGLKVGAEVTGTVRPVPAGVGLTAYRIVQEALSNAMRHAPGSDVRIEVGYQPAAMRLSVVNGPPPGGAAEPAPPGGGHGLIGMRERTGMLGADLSVGPTPDGGFAVRAALPLKEDS